MAKSNANGDDSKLTPMVRQYRELKARHRDKILLFRLGDFYEMFDEDAQEASQILNIALTKRQESPMCGFPYHAAAQYIQKLVQAGKKVAICEQLEDPSQAKGIVKRDIVNIITPGTITEENYIARKENNFLCVVYSGGERIAAAFVDISTGEFFISAEEQNAKYRFLQDELARFSPAEIIYNEEMNEDKAGLTEITRAEALYQSFPKWYFEEIQAGEEPLKEVNIPPEVQEDPMMRRCLNAAFNYLWETQFQSLSNIREIRLMNKSSLVELDDFTIRNLELVRNMQDGTKKFTLLEVLDNTITPMGGRLLRRRILMPLYDLDEIYSRLNKVEVFYEDSLLSAKIRAVLKQVSDIDRLTARVALGKALPRELIALSDSLRAATELKQELSGKGILQEIAAGIEELPQLVELVGRAVYEEPSSTFGGNVIRPGFHAGLDEVRSLMREGKDWIIKLQAKERERTGISSLKVKYNKVFGYFIEISKSNLASVPADYIRKQSLVNAERYTIPELSEYEMKITTASERVVSLEEEIFRELVEETAKYIPQLQAIASRIAEIDVVSGLAETARTNRYIKPQVDGGDDFWLKDGRHPVVEKYMGFNLFVPNDVRLDSEENRILILTGPNMAGKSTYLRQTALIAIMAQMGSYVPASVARIGMIDRIFTRIGASDQLSAGRSTFLVEMEEAANILRNSTSKSLIIMDELGRGTSTYDGLSIAWAVIEYLHEHPKIGGKTLFATHYHELTKLGEKRGIKNYNIAVREYGEELIFLRKVVEGPADRSYGIYVARLAGIDPEIIERARIILENLESEGERAKERIERRFDHDYRKKKTASDLELFPSDQHGNVVEKIRNLDVNRITPMEAITFLSEIKKELGK